MFQPGFSLGPRLINFVYKGFVFALIGMCAGLVGTATSNGLLALRKKLDPNYESKVGVGRGGKWVCVCGGVVETGRSCLLLISMRSKLCAKGERWVIQEPGWRCVCMQLERLCCCAVLCRTRPPTCWPTPPAGRCTWACPPTCGTRCSTAWTWYVHSWARIACQWLLLVKAFCLQGPDQLACLSRWIAKPERRMGPL